MWRTWPSRSWASSLPPGGPRTAIGWLFLAAGLALGLSGFSDQYGLHALVAAPGSWPAGRAVAWLSNWIWVIPVAVLAFVFLLFPTGRLRSRRWRPAAWFVGGVFTLTHGRADGRAPPASGRTRSPRPASW